MNRKLLQLSAQCLAIGFVAGLRSMSAPAAMLDILVEQPSDKPLPDFIKNLASEQNRKNVLTMAAGEMIVEKLPFIPPRTQQPGLTFRCASGTGCGALLAYIRSGSPVLGGLLGFTGAYLGSYAGYATRKWISDNLHVSSALVGLQEDFVTAGLAVAVTTSN